MQNNRKFVCLGVDWSENGQPALRMSSRQMPAPSFLLPLKGILRFQITEPQARFCIGWFKLQGKTFTHINCQRWEVINTAKQCQQCMRLEGFTSVHQAHRQPESLREDVRFYLMQPHYLYMAVFADGSLKVGTVAESRLSVRLAEQGAVAAFFIAYTTDGLIVRQVEEAVSASLSISQSLSSVRKLHALTNKVQIERLTSRLVKMVHEARVVIDRLGWVESLDMSYSWTPPASALIAFSSSPAEEYTSSFKEGEHSLYIRGVTGTIAVFAIRNERNPTLFVADLSNLKGREVQFGDYWSPTQSVQTSLF